MKIEITSDEKLVCKRQKIRVVSEKIIKRNRFAGFCGGRRSSIDRSIDIEKVERQYVDLNPFINP